MKHKNWTYAAIPGAVVPYKVPKEGRALAKHADPDERVRFHLMSLAHLRRCTGAPV